MKRKDHEATFHTSHQSHLDFITYYPHESRKMNLNQPQEQPQEFHQQYQNPALTFRDVLNGRGQGVQRHPGNVKYRTLVFVNKVRSE